MCLHTLPSPQSVGTKAVTSHLSLLLHRLDPLRFILLLEVLAAFPPSLEREQRAGCRDRKTAYP